VLRYEPITPFTARIVVEDLEHRGVTFPAGTVVMISSFTANRDLGPDAAEPQAFDISADRGAAKPLTFGAGIHHCLGANLARAELEEGLLFLAARMPGLELAGEPVFGTVSGIYGLDELPIRFEPAT
jgi:cytochrome P450